MRVVVRKYGGSSVADAARIGRVADRVAALRAAEGCGVVVVVSAMAGETDRLLALARAVAPVPSRRELDVLLSTGERTSMALLALALEARGVPACSLTGSQSGIITDEHHADARVLEVRPDRILRELAAGRVVVVGGFQGVSRARDITTLGRGGSDTTAVVLAAAVEAERCEILSDVDGVWSADPRLVGDAFRHDALPADLALALARGGAKVLYEDAVRRARDAGVTIVAGTSFGPGAGTRIAGDVAAAPGAVAVTADDRLVAVAAGADPQATRDAVVAAGGRVRRMHDGLWFVDARNMTRDLPGSREVAIVSAVGSALGEDAAAAHRGGAALAAAGVAVGWCAGAGDAIAWEVARPQVADAVRALHEALVAAPG